MEFTERELEIISNALLALTENTDKALSNVYNGNVIVALYKLKDEYNALKKKVCLML